MTLDEFETQYKKRNRSEKVFDYGLGIMVLLFALALFYKGLFGSRSNSIIYFCAAVIMITAGIMTLWSVVKKYQIKSVPIKGRQYEQISLIEKIATHYSAKAVLAEMGHVTFWIHGGLTKISYIVEMYVTDDQVLYNLRMSRGIVDVFGTARKKRMEFEELIRSLQ